MRSCAYDELYLPYAQRTMGEMYDYAVNDIGIYISEFHSMFMISGMALQFEMGNPAYIAGMNGCELARRVINSCSDRRIDLEDNLSGGESSEYWTGSALSYYQWKSGIKFKDINECCPIEEMYDLYEKYKDRDIALFANKMDKKCSDYTGGGALRRLRLKEGLSQRQLSLKSGVPIRQIQLFEQQQRDISKTQGRTLYQLSEALGCDMEDLIR